MRSFLLLTLLAAAHAQTWQLFWADEFDGPEIDINNWNHEVTMWGGGNSEFEAYTTDPANSYIQNGVLHIKPTRTMDNINPFTDLPFGEAFLYDGTMDLIGMYGYCTQSDNDGCLRVATPGNFAIPPVMSARLRSKGRFSFKYGRVEVRAIMPTGDWLWPAIWLLPELDIYGGWPRSGEIDMVEIIGNEDLLDVNSNWRGFQHMGSTMHWGPNWDRNCYSLTTSSYENTTSPYGRNFHDYALERTTNGLRFFIDDVEILTVPNPPIDQNPGWTNFWDFAQGTCDAGYTDPGWVTPLAPFDEAFHFLMNVAVGGTNYFFPDDGVNRGGDPQYTKPWANTDGHYQAMEKLWNRHLDWEWTWSKEGDFNAMQVDYVRVYTLEV